MVNSIKCSREIKKTETWYTADADETRQFCLVSNCIHTADNTVLSRLDPVSMSFISSRPSFQFATNSLFTSPTWTRQNCLVLSAVVFTPSTRQDKTVSSCPRRRCEHNWRRDKTVLSCRVGSVNTTADKTRQFCPVSNCVHTADVDQTRHAIRLKLCMVFNSLW